MCKLKKVVIPTYNEKAQLKSLKYLPPTEEILRYQYRRTNMIAACPRTNFSDSKDGLDGTTDIWHN